MSLRTTHLSVLAMLLVAGVVVTLHVWPSAPYPRLVLVPPSMNGNSSAPIPAGNDLVPERAVVPGDSDTPEEPASRSAAPGKTSRTAMKDFIKHLFSGSRSFDIRTLSQNPDLNPDNKQVSAAITSMLRDLRGYYNNAILTRLDMIRTLEAESIMTLALQGKAASAPITRRQVSKQMLAFLRDKYPRHSLADNHQTTDFPIPEKRDSHGRTATVDAFISDLAAGKVYGVFYDDIPLVAAQYKELVYELHQLAFRIVRLFYLNGLITAPAYDTLQARIEKEYTQTLDRYATKVAMQPLRHKKKKEN